MMANSFLRLFAPGVLLLLATTTTTLVRRADGSSSTTDEFGDACADEIYACRADETCIGCFNPRVTESEEFEACGAALVGDDIQRSTATCVDFMAEPCCIDEISDHECLDNGAFKEMLLCYLAVQGCSEDAFTCPNSGGVSASVGIVSTLGISCAFMLLMAFRWA